MRFPISVVARAGWFATLCLASSVALGQATMSIGSDSAGPGGTAVVGLDFTTDGVQRSVTADIFFDSTVLTAQATGTPPAATVDGCLASLPAGNQSLLTSCRLVAAGQIRIILTSSDGTSPLVSAPAFGTITFDVAGSATAGTSEVIDGVSSDTTPGTSADLVMSDGLVTIAITGSAGYASSPAPGSTINLGSAVVNTVSAGSPSNITVSEVGDQQLNVTAFPFTGANAGDFSTTATPFNIADGGASVDVPVSCTPSAVGTRTATFEITNNSSNAPNAQYTVECTGLAPNVQVAPTSITLNGALGGAAPTDSFTVSNPDNGTASDAQNVGLSSAPDAAEITITNGLADNVISVGENDGVTVSCSTAAPGTFNETITVTWDDPVGGGTATQNVTVTCNIANVAPGYSSTPAPGATLAFGQIVNGQTSAPQTIDIGNENSIGSGAQAELQITGAVLSDPASFSFTPSAAFPITLPANATNGTASIDVTCGPDSVGALNETLTVQTNDGNQVYNLTCEGTSNAGLVATPNVIDGTLNLGSVPPTTTATNSITFSNSGTDPLNLTCTLTNNNGGIITSTALPSGTAIPPDFTITFDGTPPEVNTFTEVLNCTADDPATTAAPDQTFAVDVVVSGRPLVIPTLSQWGLLLMMLSLLVAGGFAVRRMTV